MSLRWYSTVVDCDDVVAQAHWWAEVLGWQVVFESPEEAAIVPPSLTPDPVAQEAWDRQPPGLVFVRVPEPKAAKNRLHLDLAPHAEDDRDAELARLLGLGARQVHVGQGPDSTWTVLADPEGNEFCVLSARDR